jgi:hypothetical protein
MRIQEEEETFRDTVDTTVCAALRHTNSTQSGAHREGEEEEGGGADVEEKYEDDWEEEYEGDWEEEGLDEEIERCKGIAEAMNLQVAYCFFKIMMLYYMCNIKKARAREREKGRGPGIEIERCKGIEESMNLPLSLSLSLSLSISLSAD